MGVISTVVHLDWLQTSYPRFTPFLHYGLTWVSTSVNLRVCSADWLRRLVPISSMAAVWVCTALLLISSIPERTFSWMKFSSCKENKQTLGILPTMSDCVDNHILGSHVPICSLTTWYSEKVTTLEWSVFCNLTTLIPTHLSVSLPQANINHTIIHYSI